MSSNPTITLPMNASDETIKHWHDLGFEIVFRTEFDPSTIQGYSWELDLLSMDELAQWVLYAYLNKKYIPFSVWYRIYPPHGIPK